MRGFGPTSTPPRTRESEGSDASDFVRNLARDLRSVRGTLRKLSLTGVIYSRLDFDKIYHKNERSLISKNKATFEVTFIYSGNKCSVTNRYLGD